MKKGIKYLAILFVFILSMGSMMACGGNNNTGNETKAADDSITADNETGGDDAVYVDEWEIPILSAVTGNIAYVGKPAGWAAEYAAKMINEQGGINGVPIKVTVYDTQFDTAKAVTHMSSVVDDSLIVVGPMDAPGAESAGQVAFDAGVPNIASYSFADIRAQYSPFAIAYMTDSEEGDWLAAQEWLKINDDIESVVIFTCPTDTSQMATTELLKEMLPTIGVEVKGVVEVASGQLDCGPSAVQAINMKADGYISVLRADEYAKIVVELRNRGVEEGRRITASFSSYSVNTFEVAGDALDGTYIWNKMNPDYEGEEWQALVEAYQQDFDGESPVVNPVPDFYNALMAIKQCYEELGITGNPDKAEEEKQLIAEWLNNSPVIEGIQGEFQWVDGKKEAPVYFFQMEGNVPKAVTTE